MQQDLLAILTTYTARANGQKFRKLYGVKIDEPTAELILKFHSQKASITTIEKELALAGKSTDENGRSINATAIYRWIRRNGKVVRKLKRLNPVSDDSSALPSSGLDSLGQFIRAKLVKNEGRTRFRLVCDAYAEFCRVHSLFTLAKNQMSSQLRNAGFKLCPYNGYLCVAAQMVK